MALDSFIRRVAPLLGIQTTRSLVSKNLLAGGSVLELGCGRDSTVLACGIDVTYLGVDAHPPYLESIAAKFPPIPGKREYVTSLFENLDFERRSFDQVVLIDVLEHLTFDEGSALLDRIESWARISILLKTTNGFVPQGQMDGNVYQRHLSGWNPQDLLSRGYSLFGLSGMKVLRRNLALDTWSDDLSLSMRFRPRKVWLGVAGLSQILTYKFPSAAFELYAVKRLM